MPIHKIHTFLVRPGRGRDQKLDAKGTEIALSGGLFNLLGAVYDRSDTECDIQISFRPGPDGTQENACRDLITNHLRHRTIDTAKLLAERLSDTTDGRSGLGLLFLIAGKEGSHHKIVISRFPTDSAIFVDDDAKKLSVEFLERVFMKNKSSYKAAVYHDGSLAGGFWTGRAIDRQIGSRGDHLSDYWISDFLLSDFATTPAHGSRRLGQALSEAIKMVPLGVKEELIAAARLAKGLAGKPTSIDGLSDTFGLSTEARDALVGRLRNKRTAQERFTLDYSELRNYVAYRSVELDNGALLTAETAAFEEVFDRTPVGDGGLMLRASGVVGTCRSQWL